MSQKDKNIKEISLKNINKLMLCTGLFIFGCSGTIPNNLGVKDGNLASCPDKPNCVSSQAKDKKHLIDPLPWQGSPESSLTEIIKIIENMPRTKIIKQENCYLYVEFKSALMGFVDDVEFFADNKAQIIHVRSASRLGYSDLGVNRKRIESIRSKMDRL